MNENPDGIPIEREPYVWCAYPEKEECDSKHCNNTAYTAANITCNRCEKSNYPLFNTIYHCVSCDDKNMVYFDEYGSETHGFDLCFKCYHEEPNFIKNRHTLDHKFQKITRNEMIHSCSVCEEYFCSKCRITSRPLKIPDLLLQMETLFSDDEVNYKEELARKSICLKCNMHFQSQKLLEIKKDLVENLPIPNELIHKIKEFI